MLVWDLFLIGFFVGLNFDWFNWNFFDIWFMLGINEWLCDFDNKLLQVQKFILQDVFGFESLVFDFIGVGFYIGVFDGCIFCWDGDEV